ncbi:MAG: glutamine synthetase family protein, partial [Gammaproteobacteria bacterium]
GDLSGHFFGKRYPLDRLVSFARDGLAFPRSTIALSTLGEPLEGIYYGDGDGDPDAHFYLIPGTLSLNNWGSKPRAQIMATSYNGKEPTFFEPRNLLTKVLQAYETKNWYPTVAFELEFFLFAAERDAQDLIQIVHNPKTGRPDSPTVLSSTRISDFEQVIDGIVDACKQQNIETGAISSEMGAGQFEINFNHHNDVLRAADETCLFKRIVVEVAKKNRMMATFMAKPMLDQPGNGLHMHISVVDNKGRNIFDAGDRPHQRLLQAIGGLLDTMPAAMSFWAPNINSYRRYVGGANCAPVSLSWGHENRTVAFRIPLAKNGAWRVENRVPGADANPYLAMAVTLAGMLHGMKQKLDPGNPVSDSVEGTDENLPLSLSSALSTTIGSEALIDILGRDFIDLYCQHRGLETEAFAQYISPREYDWYL